MANLQMQARKAVAGIARPRLSWAHVEAVKHKPFGCTSDMPRHMIRELRNVKNFYYGITLPLPVPLHSTEQASQTLVQRLLSNQRLTSFRTWLKTSPWSFAVIIATTKAGTADYMAQKYIEGAETIDKRRLALFCMFGATYSGTLNHFLYVKVYPYFFGVRSFANTVRMNFMDNFVNTPFVFFPTLYVLKEAIVSRGTLSDAFTKYKAELYRGCRESWELWIPVHFITFGVIPVWMRTAFTTVFSFVFYTRVSMQQHKFDIKRRELEESLEIERLESLD